MDHHAVESAPLPSFQWPENPARSASVADGRWRTDTLAAARQLAQVHRAAFQALKVVDLFKVRVAGAGAGAGAGADVECTPPPLADARVVVVRRVVPAP